MPVSTANNALLLQKLAGNKNRRAKFVSAIALAAPGKETTVVEGECEGVILHELKGTGGFGYDPLFLYETGKTFAQMTDEEKNAVSHRARAAEKMLAYVKSAFGGQEN